MATIQAAPSAASSNMSFIAGLLGVLAIGGLVMFVVRSRGIDQERFEPLYRAGKQMSGATSVGVSLARYRELLQALATEIDIAEDKANSDIENRMVVAYRSVLKDFKDAETVWQAKIELTRVYKDEPVKLLMAGASETFFGPIVDRYDLRDMVIDGAISADELQQEIWAVASKDLALAEAIYNGTPAPK